MTILVRTGDLPVRQRHDAWRDVVCEVLGPLELSIDRDAPLEGEIEVGRVGPVGVGRVVTSTRHSVRRTAGLISGDGPRLYRMVLAVAGRPRLSQDGRAGQLEPGQFAVYDFNRPYEVTYDAGVKLAVFSFPQQPLAHLSDAIAGLTVTPLGGGPDDGGGTAAVAGPLFRRVALDHGTYAPASAARLSTVMTDLLTTVVAERLDRAGALPDDTRERTLLHRAHAFIEAHLSEFDLGPAVIAAAHHVSLRQLHRLFAAEDTTVSAWVRHRRLERCRADLEDPARDGEPVAAIGARWGLADPSHFSRLFRRAYGVSPGEYRRAHRLTPA